MNQSGRSLRILLVAFAMLSFIALNAGIAHGQAISGNLTGTVTDASGAAVNAATVEAVNIDTAQKVTTTTRGSGEYLFSNLPVGNYKVTVTATGFRTTNLASVPVDLNKTGTANVQLQVGTSATTVEVSGVAPPVDTTTAQLQSTYNETFSKDLGLTSNGQGGGVLNLSMLSPGVTNANALGDGTGPSVGGQRPRDNNFTVEGVDNNNKTVTGALLTVPNDAVEDFTLISNQFNSEFGHSSGGQFNTSVKSGTNNFHGSLYEYFRNRNMDAMDNAYVNQGLTTNPRFDSNRYGATFGGPIIKNKLFFFDLFERNPVGLTSGIPAAIAAPTAAGLAAIATDPLLSQTNFGVFKQYVPVAPASGGAAACIPYAGLPANGACAAGSVDSGSISIVPPAFQNYENFVQSVDFNYSEKDQLRFRYLYNKFGEPDTNAQLPVFFTTLPEKFHLINLAEYHTFTPTLLNEFRVGFNRFTQFYTVGPQKFPGLDAFPNIVLSDLGAGGLNIGPDSNAPQFTVQNVYQFIDNITWTKGKHNWKFGGEYRWYISPQQFTQRARGDYEYNTSQRFLEDVSPDILGQRSTGSTTYYGNQKAVYWYANDSWRVTPHLTANLGVRYEYTSTPLGEQRQSLNAISNTPSIIVPQVNEPLLFNAPSAPKHDFAPRIGLAYSPGNTGTTSVRAGFGMAYDTLYDNIGILAVPPQVGSTNNVDESKQPIQNFLKNGGLGGGGSGLKSLSRAQAIAATSDWIPPDVKYPYSINWNLGVQHSFGKNYSAEVGYVGTRGNRLDVQNILDFVSPVNSSYFLPTFLQAPSQATLNSLTTNLAYGANFNNISPAFFNAGFSNAFNPVTGFIPEGWSTYHALQTQLTRRFSNGLQFMGAYTWSHTIDNSTADFHSTDLTPRRQQDFFNSSVEKATSALSRTNRFTIAAVYALPYFKTGNWLMQNVVGNWQFSPVYTYESPQLASAQSAVDANLNGDSAGDRVIFNPSGIKNTGSGVTALCTSALPAGTPCDPAASGFASAPYVVGYLANNPSAQYIQAGYGALADTRRNSLVTKPTNNFDLATYKDLSFTERFKFRLGGQFGNLFNHPQYLPGSNPGLGLGVNDVLSFSTCCSTSAYRNFTNPSKPSFLNDKATFGSNARTIAIVAKFTF